MASEAVKTTPPEFRSARKQLTGTVVSDKMDKTRVIEVAWQSTHSRYGKVLRRTTRLHAHDEKNETHAGDKVTVVETRPLSKLKRWRIETVVEKAR